MVMKLYRKEHVEFDLNAFESVILTWETKNVPDSRKNLKMSSCNSFIQMKPLQLIAINSNYANWVTSDLMQKSPSVANNRRIVILLHDNARPHVAKSVKQTLLQFEWEVLLHPTYSPNMTPSDYHLFRLIQHALTDTHFSSYEEEIQKWMNEWISSKDIAFYHRGIVRLPERWEKIVENGGNYFD